MKTSQVPPLQVSFVLFCSTFCSGYIITPFIFSLRCWHSLYGESKAIVNLKMSCRLSVLHLFWQSCIGLAWLSLFLRCNSVGRVLALGARSHRFKSCHFDHLWCIVNEIGCPKRQYLYYAVLKFPCGQDNQSIVSGNKSVRLQDSMNFKFIVFGLRKKAPVSMTRILPNLREEWKLFKHHNYFLNATMVEWQTR